MELSRKGECGLNWRARANLSEPWMNKAWERGKMAFEEAHHSAHSGRTTPGGHHESMVDVEDRLFIDEQGEEASQWLQRFEARMRGQ